MSFPRLQKLMQRDGMSDKFQTCWFRIYSPASEDEIAAQLVKRPWLSEDYLEFLRLTNGATLEMFVLYEIREAGKKDDCVEPFGSEDWFPVGHDPSDDVFVIHRSGCVATISSDPPPEEPIPLCDTFPELIEDVCCGPRYIPYFGGTKNETEWFDYLRGQGWVD
ncbi:MAG: SMI1/KNR4 family protein, partial [Planctomycetaceae bacterium]|nr:SMI1/KNR4 family protein [Planctomycetaceae bacterium]